MALTELHTVVMSAQQYVAAGNIPAPGNTALPGNAATQLNTVLGWIKYLGLAAAFVGLFLTAGKMAVSHRTGQGGEHVAGLGYVAGSPIILGSASAVIGFLG